MKRSFLFFITILLFSLFSSCNNEPKKSEPADEINNSAPPEEKENAPPSPKKHSSEDTMETETGKVLKMIGFMAEERKNDSLIQIGNIHFEDVKNDLDREKSLVQKLDTLLRKFSDFVHSAEDSLFAPFPSEIRKSEKENYELIRKENENYFQNLDSLERENFDNFYVATAKSMPLYILSITFQDSKSLQIFINPLGKRSDIKKRILGISEEIEKIKWEEKETKQIKIKDERLAREKKLKKVLAGLGVSAIRALGDWINFSASSGKQ